MAFSQLKQAPKKGKAQRSLEFQPIAVWWHLNYQCRISSVHLNVKKNHLMLFPRLPFHLEKKILSSTVSQIDKWDPKNVFRHTQQIPQHFLRPLPMTLYHSSIRSSCLKMGGKEDRFARLARTLRCSAVGRISTCPSIVPASTTVWSPSPTSSRQPLISACASPIHHFDVVMPFHCLLNIWSTALRTAKSSQSGFTRASEGLTNFILSLMFGVDIGQTDAQQENTFFFPPTTLFSSSIQLYKLLLIQGVVNCIEKVSTLNTGHRTSSKTGYKKNCVNTQYIS